MEDATNDIEDATSDIETNTPPVSGIEDASGDMEDASGDIEGLETSQDEQAALPPGEVVPPIDIMDPFTIPGSSAVGLKTEKGLPPASFPLESKEETWAKYSDSASKATVNGLRKTFQALGIPARAITQAIGRFSEGASAGEVADSVGQVLSMSERADAPTLREAVFQASLKAGSPEMARKSANTVGLAADALPQFATDMATGKAVGALAKVGPFASAIRVITRPATKLANNAGEGITKAFVQLPPERFEEYLNTASQVQAAKSYTFEIAAKEIAATYKELHERAIAGSRAARQLLVNDDSVITVGEMQKALDQAANGIISNAPDQVRTKIGIRTGASGRAAEDTYGMYKADILDNAKRGVAGQSPVEWIGGRRQPPPPSSDWEKATGIPLPEHNPVNQGVKVVDIKEIIQGLDNEIQWQVKANMGQDPKTLLAWRYRKNIDNLLKAKNPEYAEEMIPVAKINDAIEHFDNRIIKSSKLTAEEQIYAKIIHRNPTLAERNALKSLDDIAETDYTSRLANRQLYEEVERGLQKGPKLGRSIGGAIGMAGAKAASMASGESLGFGVYGFSAAAGAGIGQVFDKLGAAMAMTVAKALMSRPETAARTAVTSLSGIPITAGKSARLFKFLLPGIAISQLRKVIGEDATPYEDTGDMKITDYGTLQATEKAIRADKSISTGEQMTLIRGMKTQYLDNGYFSLSMKEDDGKEDKSEKIRKIIMDLRLKKAGK
jgi:hypothetical protein